MNYGSATMFVMGKEKGSCRHLKVRCDTVHDRFMMYMYRVIRYCISYPEDAEYCDVYQLKLNQYDTYVLDIIQKVCLIVGAQ